MACNKDGKILAEEFEIAYDKGAYDETSDVSTKGNRFMGAPYSIPSVRGVSKGVFTNTAFSTAFRGYGSPQVYTASEQMVDQLAEAAGIDPLEFRYINVCRPGDTSINSHTYDCYPMADLIDKIRPHYEEAKKRTAEWNAVNKGPIRRGIGVSSAHYNVCGGPNDESMMAMQLRPDGVINVFSGWEDQGQGGDIGTLIHAHESLRKAGFDITPDGIHLIMNDTALCPPAGPAAASRSNYMNGRALENAAQNLAAALKKEDGTFRTYDEAIADGVDTNVMGVYSTAGFTFPIDDNTGQAEGNGPTPTYTYGIYVSEVEVDTTTGKTTVLSMHCATDVGTVTSVQGLIGQALGGMQQSLGFALSEDYQDHNKDTNLVKCGFPYINDVPDDLDVILQETPRETGAHGSSGASEVYLSGGHVSIINAIYNAVGVRVKNLPATPDKVLALIKLKEEGKEPAKVKYNFGIDLYDDLDYIAANPEYRDPEVAVGPAL
jgi:aldehyde oxidoreductase